MVFNNQFYHDEGRFNGGFTMDSGKRTSGVEAIFSEQLSICKIKVI